MIFNNPRVRRIVVGVDRREPCQALAVAHYRARGYIVDVGEIDVDVKFARARRTPPPR